MRQDSTAKLTESAAPAPGQVIGYAYLWSHEHDRGRQEAVKDRPCAVILTVRRESVEPGSSARPVADTMVYLLPITSVPPAAEGEAVAVPAATRRRLGLQEAPCWIVLTELNRFVWPGPDLRPVERPAGAFYSFGLLPKALFDRVRDAFVARLKQGDVRRIPRTE